MFATNKRFAPHSSIPFEDEEDKKLKLICYTMLDTARRHHNVSDESLGCSLIYEVFVALTQHANPKPKLNSESLALTWLRGARLNYSPAETRILFNSNAERNVRKKCEGSVLRCEKPPSFSSLFRCEL
jgi:hypothetical protein